MKRLLAFSSALALVVGCSLVGDFSTERCLTDGDCSEKGLTTFVCRGGNCEPQETSPFSDAGEEAEAAKPSECSTSDECSQRASDVPTACVAGACVAIEIPGECALFGKDRFREPDAILLGAFVEETPSISIGGLNIDHALSEINVAGGVPTPEGRRYVAVVACSKATPALVKTGAAHLIEKLHVPAVYGQVETAELKELIPGAKGTLLVSTLANDATVRTPTDGSLLWFATDDVARVAAGYGPLLTRLEAVVRAGNGDKDVKIALLETQSVETRALADALLASTTIKVNGRSLQENEAQTPAPLLKRIGQIPSIYRNPSEGYSSFVGQVTAYQPDIILGVNGDELVTKLLPGIEDTWGAGTLPRYVASPLSRYNVQLYSRIVSDGSKLAPRKLAPRFFGIDFAGDREVYAEYDRGLADYLAATPNKPREGFNLLYDTTYLLTFAARAALKTGAPLDGARMSEGIKRLVKGRVAYVGTKNLPGRAAFTDIMNGLAGEESFLLTGTTGPFDLDPTTHDRKGGASVYCVRTSLTDIPRFTFYSLAVSGEQLVSVPADPPSPCLP